MILAVTMVETLLRQETTEATSSSEDVGEDALVLTVNDSSNERVGTTASARFNILSTVRLMTDVART
jgi:hypothetical protein